MGVDSKNKKTRSKSLTYQEKIDLFKKYLDDPNTPNEITQDTVYEGYSIGNMLAGIRCDLKKDPETKKIKQEEKDQLANLGLLDKKHESTLAEKINRLEAFCKENPEFWYASHKKKTLETYLSQIESEDEKKELLDKLKTAQSDCLYIRTRKSVGERQGNEIVSEEDCKRLKEAGVLGVFGYPKEIEELAQKYKAVGVKNPRDIESNKRQIEGFLYEQSIRYGGLENFKRKYVEALLRGEEIGAPKNISKILIKSFDLSSVNFINVAYSEYMNDMRKIAKRKEPVIVYKSKDVRKEIERLTQREEKVIQLSNGLDGNDKKSAKEIGETFSITGAAVFEIIKRANNKLLHKFRPNNMFRTYYDEKTIERFVKIYFEKNDIFANEEGRLDEQVKTELLNILGLEVLTKDIRNIYGPTRLDEEDYKKIYDQVNHHEFYSSYAIIPDIERQEMLSEFWEKKMLDSEDQDFVKKIRFYDVIKNKVYYREESDYNQIYNISEVPVKMIGFSTTTSKKLEEDGINTLGDIIYNYAQADIIQNDEIQKVLNNYGIHLTLEMPEEKKKMQNWKKKRNETGIEELGISQELQDRLKEQNVNTIGDLLKTPIEDEQVYAEVKRVVNSLNWGLDFDRLQADMIEEMNSPLGQIKKMPIVDLNISVRAYNSLTRAEIFTVGDIIGMRKDDLEKVRNLGKTSYGNILQKLNELGIVYDEEKDCFCFNGKEIDIDLEDEEVEEEKGTKSITIDELNISARTYATLKKAEVETIGDMVDNSVKVRSIRNLRKKTFEDMKGILELLGYKYDEEQECFVEVKNIAEEKEETKPEESSEQRTESDLSKEATSKEEIDGILDSKIQEIEQAYEESKQKDERIKSLMSELKVQIMIAIQEKEISSKKVAELDQMLNNNSEILKEKGVFEKFTQKLEEEKARLAQKEKEEQELKNLQEELKKELDDMEL